MNNFQDHQTKQVDAKTQNIMKEIERKGQSNNWKFTSGCDETGIKICMCRFMMNFQTKHIHFFENS